MLVLAGCLFMALVAVKFGGALWAQAETPKPAEGTLVMFDFEDEDGLKKFDANKSDAEASTEHATSGKQSLKVTLKAGETYAGLYTERFPTKDWMAYSKLKFDIFVDEAVTLGMTLKDVNSKDYATRYNRDSIELEKGANTVTIELVDAGDKIDLKKIKSMSLFAGKVDKNTVFYLDNVRLEK
jgi:hypothetical protein